MRATVAIWPPWGARSKKVAFGDNGLEGQLLGGDLSTFEAMHGPYIKTTTLTDMPLSQLQEQIRLCGTKEYNLYLGQIFRASRIFMNSDAI